MRSRVPRKIRQLKADLRKAGFVEDTDAGKGSHTSWVHPDDPANKVVFSGHDGADAPRYLEQQVRRALARARKETEP